MWKRLFFCTPMILLLLALGACGKQTISEDALALQVRKQYLDMTYCTGEAMLHADYGERVYDYRVSFQWQKDGEMVLEILEPERLVGTSARIAAGETYLSFDGVSLETGPLSPDGLSPIDAIPAALRYLCEGYIAACGSETRGERDCLRLQMREPNLTAGEGTEAVLWLDKESGALLFAELMQDGITVLRAEFLNFTKEIAVPSGA